MASESKKRLIDPKQRTLFGVLGLGYENEKVEIDKNNNTEVHISTDNEKKPVKIVRNWNDKWLKCYSWLRSEVESDSGRRFMFCRVCTDGGKFNALHKSKQNTNFQNSTLSRQADLDDHKALLKLPKQQQELNKALKRTTARQDFAATVLLKVVHWLAVEDIPFTKYESLLGLLLNFSKEELDSLQILKKPAENKPNDKGLIQYDSSTTCSGLLDSLAIVVEQDLNRQLQSSKFVTALADESTDITNNKRLVIYARLIDNDTMKPSTRFLTNLEIHDATGKGIGEAILREFIERGVPAEKIMSLGSDGASVMTGRKTGCAAIMKPQNPHMYNVHCVAHRLALCSSQAAENITTLKQHQQVLTDLFYYFKVSAKRSGGLHEIQSILDEPTLTIKEIHSVRWLSYSYFNALTAVYRTLESLLTYLAEAKQCDPKAIGLRKKIASDTFLSITFLMMDAMAPITVLSQFFQTENVDVALVKVKLDLCMRDISNIKSLETPHLKILNGDLPPGANTYIGHTITRHNINLERLATEFADSLISNIKSRFPEDDILTAFSVLSMRPLTFLNEKDTESYGVTEMDTLCDFNGKKQTISWVEEGQHFEKCSDPLIDSTKTMDEWFLLKKVVVAEKYSRDKMAELWWYINKYHHDQFPNLIILASLALTCSVHTAGCERGFSVQNRILTTFRNRLGSEKQIKLMLVKIDGSDRQKFCFDDALKHWKSCKERRIYEMICFK